jgi:Tfp pilus assembly protein PilF
LALALLALVAAVYAPTLRHDFVWDDHEQVVNNPFLRHWSSFSEFWRQDILSLSRGGGNRSNYYRPLFYVQYLIYYQLFGLNPLAWHGLAILQHFLATLAVVFFLRRLGLSLPTAAAAAALFAVHPAHGESVSWVAAAFNDPPAAALLLLALGAHSRWLQARRPVYLAGAALAFAAALGLKESALSLLLLVPLVDEYLDPDRSWPRRALAYLPFWLLIAAYLAYQQRFGTVWLPQQPHLGFALELGALLGLLFGFYRLLERRGRSSASRAFFNYVPYFGVAVAYFYLRKVMILTMFGVYSEAAPIGALLPTLPLLLLFYLRLLVWPVGLAPSYPLRYVLDWSSWEAMGPFLLLIALLGVVAWLVWKRRVLRFCALWTLACILPALNIRAFRPTYLVHQRYLYLASLGLCLALAWSVGQWVRTPHRRAALLAAVFVIWSASTLYHNRFWASDIALWSRVAEVDPHNPAAFDFLGGAALKAGRTEEAEGLFRRSIAADPNSPHGYMNLAVLLQTRRGHPDRAVPLYQHALAAFELRWPQGRDRYLDCQINYGACLAQAGRRQEGLSYLLRLANTPPYPVAAARNAAVLLYQEQRLDQVEAVLSGALKRHPGEPKLLAMLADVYRTTGREREALALLKRSGAPNL